MTDCKRRWRAKRHPPRPSREVNKSRCAYVVMGKYGLICTHLEVRAPWYFVTVVRVILGVDPCRDCIRYRYHNYVYGVFKHGNDMEDTN